MAATASADAHSHPFTFLLSLLIPGTLITLTLALRFRSEYVRRSNLFSVKIIGVLLLYIATMAAVLVSGSPFLTEDTPLYRVTMTGDARDERVAIGWHIPLGDQQAGHTEVLASCTGTATEPRY